MIVGTNLTGPVDSSTEYPFSDLFKASRPWISGSATQWDDKRPISVDENGWVKSLLDGQVVRTAILAGQPKLPAGDLHLTFDGEGEVHLNGQKYTASGVFKYDGKSELFMNIVKTNPVNYVRGIKIRTIAGFPAKVFDDVFLKQTQFPVIRFMDFQFTNHSKQSEWKDRSKVTDARWNNKGVPLEVMANLCNYTESSGWFCIPHLATDEYVYEMCRVLEDKMSEMLQLQIYLEFSNECWNDIMEQAKYCRQKGLAEKLHTDPVLAGYFWYAKRAVEIFRIAKTVIPKNRLVCVLGAHNENPWALEQMLAFQNTRHEIDAVGIAPYFGNSYGHDPLAIAAKNMSVPEFAKALRMEVERAVESVRKCRYAIRNPQTKLLAYEAGQHLVGHGAYVDDPKLNYLFDAVNRSEEMYDLYKEYLKGCAENGIEVLCHFVNSSGYSKWGRWGALEYTWQSTSPKYRALAEWK